MLQIARKEGRKTGKRNIGKGKRKARNEEMAGKEGKETKKGMEMKGKKGERGKRVAY